MKKFICLVDSPDTIKGTIATWDGESMYDLEYEGEGCGCLSRKYIENRPQIWAEVPSVDTFKNFLSSVDASKIAEIAAKTILRRNNIECACGMCSAERGELQQQDAKQEEEKKEETATFPGKNQNYFTIDEVFGVKECVNRGQNTTEKHRACVGVFRSKEDAESELKLRQSMLKRWRPDEGFRYWTWDFEDKEASSQTWDSDGYDIEMFLLGNVHYTKKQAEAYGKEMQPVAEHILENVKS